MLITGDTTFDATDVGIFHLVTAAAVLTIPSDADVDDVVADEIFLFVDTASAVTLAVAEGVTLKTKGTTLTQNGYVTLCKIAANTWIAFGDLS